MATRNWTILCLTLAASLPGAPAHAESFENYLAYTYLHNPALVAEREKLKSIDEGVAEAVSGFRPSVGAEYDRGRERTRYRGTEFEYDDAGVKELHAEQPIFHGFESLSSYHAAQERVKAGRAELAATEQRVLFDAIAAYADVLEKRAVLALNRNNIDLLARQRAASKSRFQSGELTQTDVAQSEARLARALAEHAQAVADAQSADSNFFRVIGQKPDVAGLPPLPPLPATLEEAQAIAAQKNPALLQAQHIEKATDSDVSERYAALSPNVSLQGRASDYMGQEVPGINGYRQDTVTLNVSIPLYQSGAEYARIREARDLHQKAIYDAMDTNRETTLSVERAWQEFHAAQGVISSSDIAVQASHGALAGVREENKAGTRSVLDVLDAEQEDFSAQLTLQRARYGQTLSAYRLLAAMGQLNAEHLRLPVEIYDPHPHYNHVRWLPAGFE